MFWPDVLEYKSFYSSHLGSVVTLMLEKLLHDIWPDAGERTITGLGYPLPLLHDLMNNQHAFAFMPAQQGVIHWPHGQPNRTILTDDTELPMADNSTDRMIMLHMAEHSASPVHLLEEAWRVLSPGGRLLIVVPNRSGVWARLDSTPFGHGRPFSQTQLRSIVEESRFTQIKCGRMLFFPPTDRHFILRYAGIIEKICRWLYLPFGGLLWMEVEKQVYAIRKAEAVARRFRPVAALEGAN